MGKKELIFRNNEQLLFQYEKSAKFIQPLTRTDTLQNKKQNKTNCFNHTFKCDFYFKTIQILSGLK